MGIVISQITVVFSAGKPQLESSVQLIKVRKQLRIEHVFLAFIAW